MMHSAAPLLFRAIPRKILADSAVVRIDRPHRSGRRGGAWHERPRWRGRRGRRWRWRGRRRWEWCWRNGGCRLRQSSRGATPTDCHAAVVFLRLGPSPLYECVIPTQELTSLAIVWQRSGLAGQEPQQQRDEQQKTQKAATRDDAREIPLRTPEISSITNILICCLLRVTSLASAYI